jgi:hypothetical protein
MYLYECKETERSSKQDADKIQINGRATNIQQLRINYR